MEGYDVIIVGGGPAGLHCARVLARSELSVLLLEKKPGFGDKTCAGGITGKGIGLLGLPDDLIEHRVTSTMISSRFNRSITNAPVPFVYTINRQELGRWQRQRLEGTGVRVMENARVTSIEADKVIVNQEKPIGYRFLVGADGCYSIVRRYLNLPVCDRLIGIQYQVPLNGNLPRLEMWLNSSLFHSWYGWVFPHRDTMAVGCIADPRYMNSRKLSENFHRWLKQRGIDLTRARYESQPVSYDFRGMRFGNIFLAGEAGGFASGLTGEGIYQSVVSGEAAARMIMDENYHSEALDEVIRYNRIQRRILKVLIWSGPLRILIYELLILFMNLPAVKRWVHNSFTGES